MTCVYCTVVYRISCANAVLISAFMTCIRTQEWSLSGVPRHLTYADVYVNRCCLHLPLLLIVITCDVLNDPRCNAFGCTFGLFAGTSWRMLAYCQANPLPTAIWFCGGAFPKSDRCTYRNSTCSCVAFIFVEWCAVSLLNFSAP